MIEYEWVVYTDDEWQAGGTAEDFDTAKIERAHGIKAKPNLCRLCGHEIYSHDRQYGCSEDGCDCEALGAGR